MNIVKPFIKAKIEKTIVDYFLLNDVDKLLELSNITMISKYNAFELCLLVISLRNKHKDAVSRVINYMKMKNGIYPKNRKVYESQFDSAMGVTLEEPEEEEKQNFV